ncbi:glycosyltransferase family 2 protein [uncultured Thiodictyon sp.]|uniref:glycosyltransferase family 2 protein n=1 Tax=uncultured Thiodictyon sp. TaxID=1846217 RepID=UPI0025D24B01|nr:glycosyltransferase family 2 protein [uncultured Thiodictyon sp.]
MNQAPIAYIVFNRPRQTARTFATLRAQRPAELFIIADGPRRGHPTDAERCAEARAIVEQVDWPCAIHRNYSEINLGCKKRVSSGLDWVFGQVERAIVLEDDCLPHADFFTFCSTLLEHYADDQRVWVITGANFQNGQRRGDRAYYFSQYNHVWGWATWRRAWRHYSGDLPFWPEWKNSARWRENFRDPRQCSYWSAIFDRVYADEIDTWDYPWTASVWYHGGLTATPNVNLVTNIGIGPDATHTCAAEEREGIPVSSLGALTHPTRVKQDRRADQYVFEHTFGGGRPDGSRRVLGLLRGLVGKAYRIIRHRLIS